MVEAVALTCTRCGSTKSEDEFHRNKRAKSGRCAHCKACACERSSRYYAENVEKKLEYQRRYYAGNREHYLRYYAENRERILEYGRRYRAENAEVHRDYQRQYRIENREKVREDSRRWLHENAERAAEYARKRRALMRDAAITKFTQEQLQQRVAYYGGKCWICREADYEHMDHVKPLSKGGPHCLANLRPACAACNIQKSAAWQGSQWAQSGPLVDINRNNER